MFFILSMHKSGVFFRWQNDPKIPAPKILCRRRRRKLSLSCPSHGALITLIKFDEFHGKPRLWYVNDTVKTTDYMCFDNNIREREERSFSMWGKKSIKSHLLQKSLFNTSVLKPLIFIHLPPSLKKMTPGQDLWRFRHQRVFMGRLFCSGFRLDDSGKTWHVPI